MAAFFRSVTSVLVPSAEVHVTHKMKAPFCYWNLKDLAAAANSELHYTRRLVFDPSLFPAYNNRKVASGRGKFPTWDAAVYVWTKGKPPRRIRKGVFSVASSGQSKSLLLQPLLTEAQKVFAKEREREKERFHRQGAIGRGRGGGGGKECLLDTPGLCVCVCVCARARACVYADVCICMSCMRVYETPPAVCMCERASERACIRACARVRVRVCTRIPNSRPPVSRSPPPRLSPPFSRSFSYHCHPSFPLLRFAHTFSRSLAPELSGPHDLKCVEEVRFHVFAPPGEDGAEGGWGLEGMPLDMEQGGTAGEGVGTGGVMLVQISNALLDAVCRMLLLTET